MQSAAGVEILVLMKEANTGSQTSRLMREHAAKGSHVSRVPLGYERIQTENGTLLKLDGKASELIKQAMLLVSQGATLRSALALMDKAGLRNRRGKPLSLSSLHLIVTNPFYVGRVRFNGKEYHGKQESLIDMGTHRRILKVLGKHRC